MMARKTYVRPHKRKTKDGKTKVRGHSRTVNDLRKSVTPDTIGHILEIEYGEDNPDWKEVGEYAKSFPKTVDALLSYAGNVTRPEDILELLDNIPRENILKTENFFANIQDKSMLDVLEERELVETYEGYIGEISQAEREVDAIDGFVTPPIGKSYSNRHYDFSTLLANNDEDGEKALDLVEIYSLVSEGFTYEDAEEYSKGKRWW